jgi:hypothetical protein
MNMKSLNTFLAVLALSIVTTQGAITTFYSSGANNNIVIPDDNPTGISSGIGVSGIGSVLNGLTLTINVSSGFNGDLLCYLNYGSSSVALLNRIGSTGINPFGSATAGFTSFTFSDSGSAQSTITASSGSLSGIYQAAGGAGAIDTTFGGVNPNGDWTISFFDMASGGGSSPSTLNNWSLSIDAVPEPVNVALGVFAGLGLIIIVGRSLWRKRNQAVA